MYTLILCDSYAEVTRKGGGGFLSKGMHHCCPVASFTKKNATTVTLTAGLMGLDTVCLVSGGNFLSEKKMLSL